MIDIDKYEEAIIFKQELECGGVIAVGRDDLLNIIDMLRQYEKDAARYNDDIESARFDIGNLSSKLERADSVISEVERVLSERQRNGDFSLDDLLSEAEYYINNHQGVKQ